MIISARTLIRFFLNATDSINQKAESRADSISIVAGEKEFAIESFPAIYVYIYVCVRCVSLHWIAFSTRDRRSIYKLCYGATPAEIRERMYVRMYVRVSVGIFSFFFNSIE